MKKGILLLMFILGLGYANAQAVASMQWAKVYGGSGTDYFQDICPTDDGGYIATGWTRSYGRGQDVWVVKLDGFGNVQWQKAYGTSGNEEARTPHSIKQTIDGGYVVAANCGSDFWVLKLDGDGEIQWQKKYGGTGSEFAWAVEITSDNGYVITGTTFSFNAGGPGMDADVWVLRLGESGNVLWEKSYGGGGSFQFEMAFAIKQTFDDGFVVSAYTYSWATTGYFSAWVLKLDSAGEIQWQKAYGGGGEMQGDFFNAISQTSDGSYILTGNTMSWSPGPYDSYDHTNIWAMKLDAVGNVLWSNAYGGNDLRANGGSCIEEMSDGNYIISGLTRSFGNSQSANLYDLWLLKIDPGGQILWEKAYGGTGEDGQCRNGSSARPTSDGGFILSSETASFSSGGTTDAWVLKLDADGNIPGCSMFISETNAVVTNIEDIVTITSNAVPRVSQSVVTDTAVVATQTTAVPVSLCLVDECYVNSECSAEQFCLFPEGDCEGPGTCQDLPAEVPTLQDPVCGCDGIEYANAYAAYAAGISINYTGSCLSVVVIADFYAEALRGRVKIRWITASEIDNAGFNIYRAEGDGEYELINATLIPAEGMSTEGEVYAFVDEDVKNRTTYTYMLEDMDLNGAATRYGPVTAVPRLIYGLKK